MMITGYLSGLFIVIVLVGMSVLLSKKVSPRAPYFLVLGLQLAIFSYLALLPRILPALPIAESLGGLGRDFGIVLALGEQELAWLVAMVSLLLLHGFIFGRSLREASPASLVLYLFSLFGILGIVLSRDLFNLFVQIEIFSLSLIGLIMMGSARESASLAFKYLLLNSLAAAFFLIGVIIIYRGTGILSIDRLLLLDNLSEIRAIRQATAFMATALMLKLMLFPLNLWAQRIFEKGFVPGAAYIAGIMPMLFVYDLYKLTAFLGQRLILSFVILAGANLVLYTYGLLSQKEPLLRRSSLCFIINSIMVIGFVLNSYFPAYYLFLLFVSLLALLKILLFAFGDKQQAQTDGETSESACKFCRLSLNNTILALLAITLLMQFIQL